MKPLIDKFNISALIKSLIISFAYVGLGTIAVMSEYPSSSLYGDWVLPVAFLTLPVNAISGGIMMASYPPDFKLVLIVQCIVFLIFWRIIFTWMNKRLKIKSN